MALKVKAVERLLKFDKEAAGKYRYVMKPELYSSLTQAKVIKEAALRSGVSQGVMKACWDAAGEVIKAWATEGHSVALPGLGSMRFGLRSKAVENVNDVKTSLIESRRYPCVWMSAANFIGSRVRRLVEAEEHFQAAIDAREAHEGKAQQACREHHDSHTLHTLGYLHQLQLLAHTGKHRQGQAEADGR